MCKPHTAKAKLSHRILGGPFQLRLFCDSMSYYSVVISSMKPLHKPGSLSPLFLWHVFPARSGCISVMLQRFSRQKLLYKHECYLTSNQWGAGKDKSSCNEWSPKADSIQESHRLGIFSDKKIHFWNLLTETSRMELLSLLPPTSAKSGGSEAALINSWVPVVFVSSVLFVSMTSPSSPWQPPTMSKLQGTIRGTQTSRLPGWIKMI